MAQPAFQHPGGVDFAVRTADCQRNGARRFGEGAARRTEVADHSPTTGGYLCRVVIENRGTIPVPVTIEVRYQDGTHERLTWNHRDSSRWQEFEVARSSPIAQVTIDPTAWCCWPITPSTTTSGSTATATRRGARPRG